MTIMTHLLFCKKLGEIGAVGIMTGRTADQFSGISWLRYPSNRVNSSALDRDNMSSRFFIFVAAYAKVIYCCLQEVRVFAGVRIMTVTLPSYNNEVDMFFCEVCLVVTFVT